MKKIQIKDIWLFVAQVLLLSLVLLSPGLISYVTTHDAVMACGSLWISAFWLAPAVVVLSRQRAQATGHPSDDESR